MYFLALLSLFKSAHAEVIDWTMHTARWIEQLFQCWNVSSAQMNYTVRWPNFHVYI
jgi:hypothetical protein